MVGTAAFALARIVDGPYAFAAVAAESAVAAVVVESVGIEAEGRHEVVLLPGQPREDCIWTGLDGTRSHSEEVELAGAAAWA